MTIKLVGLDDLNPSAYNPRTADPKRLDIIELSLRKLGFVLPVFADAEGEILSGHQRHLVASRMGLKKIPVSFTKPLELNIRKSINIAFNRGTNDMAAVDTPASLTEALQKADVFGLAQKLPDLSNEEIEKRCMNTVTKNVKELTKINNGRWVQYAKNAARSLNNHGVTMPIICTEDGMVVNGLGRLELAAEKGHKTVEVVYITELEKEFTFAMLNYLTMDFNIHERYEDMLRYNSFRRAMAIRDYLGRCFTFAILGRKSSNTFDVTKPKSKKFWIKNYGSTVLDFGAGLLSETKLLQSVGVDCVPFEPFRLTKGTSDIDRDLSIDTTKKFLERVASGVEFNSIFLSAIMNSVPFYQDRVHILKIIASLCSPKTKVFAVSASTKQAGYRLTSGAEFINRQDSSRLQFRLDYEPRITIADFTAVPKVQKYHTPEEWYELWKSQFEKVKVTESANNVECIAIKARSVNHEELSQALAFEFNLPYPSGKRMNLVNEAITAFSQRLQCELPSPK
tara:strand:- start:5149 stop:6678 length:1530 start_codon:yes stop_codon:yes gene_type:complete